MALFLSRGLGVLGGGGGDNCIVLYGKKPHLFDKTVTV